MKFWMGLAFIAMGIAVTFPLGIGILLGLPMMLFGAVMIVISILHGGLSVVTAPFRGRGR